MESLAVELAGMSVTQVWLEERTPSLNDRHSRLVASRFEVNGSSPRRCGLMYRSPRRSPCLWLPDIVAGAMGAARV